MIFSSKFAKFGKGENLSLFIKEPNLMSVYYFLDGTKKKEVTFTNNSVYLKSFNQTFPYHELIEINNYLITRVNKSIGIIKYE